MEADQEDSTWDQAQTDENRQLSEDPGYLQFLIAVATNQ